VSAALGPRATGWVTLARLERLRDVRPAFALYGLLALLSFPTLGHLLAGEDGIGYALDVFELPRTGVSQDWLANGLTLWNTHLTGGNALFAQQSNTPFGIDVPLAFVIGPFGAYVAVVWLLAASAGVSMHLFLRDSLRLSTVAALGGSVIYLFGFWHYIYGLAGPAIPLLLWAMDRAVDPGPRRWRFALVGAVAATVVLYHGLSQVVLFVAGIQLLHALVTASDRRAVAGRLLTWGVTWALALGLYAPLVLSQLVMLPISVRSIWDLQALDPRTAVEAMADAVRHYSQVLVGVPVGGGIGTSPARYGTYFMGAIGLPLLALGIVGARRDRRSWFLLVLLFAVPAWEAISYFAAPIQAQLGFLKSFQLVRLRHLLPFVLAANAALGLDLLARTVLIGRPLPFTGRVRRAVVAATLLPLGIAVAVAAREVVRRRHDLRLLEVPALGWTLLLVALVVGLAALALLAVAVMRQRRTGSGGVAPAVVVVALLLILAGERTAYAWGERLTNTRANLGTWAQTLGDTPATAFLRGRPGIDVDRVLSFGGRPNQVAAAGMLQVDGYQSLYPVTYHAFFGALIAPALADSPSNAIYYGAWGNRTITFGPKVDPELVALSGARWLYVLDGEVPTVPGIIARFRDGTTTIYEVSQVLPRAFVAGAVDVLRDQEDVVAALSAAGLDELRGSAFVPAGADADGLLAAVPAGAAAGTAGTATITAYTPDRVVVAVRADRSGVLVLTDVMAPGWVADRDGQTVPIATVDATFRGVAVDSATREVVFRYAPAFTYAGFAVAGVSLALMVAWALAVRQHDRRRPPPGASGTDYGTW
jgi:hypothetical protein